MVRNRLKNKWTKQTNKQSGQKPYSRLSQWEGNFWYLKIISFLQKIIKDNWHSGLCLPLHIFTALHWQENNLVVFIQFFIMLMSLFTSGFSTKLIQQILMKINLVRYLVYFCQGKKPEQTRNISVHYEERKEGFVF